MRDKAQYAISVQRFSQPRARRMDLKAQKELSSVLEVALGFLTICRFDVPAGKQMRC